MTLTVGLPEKQKEVSWGGGGGGGGEGESMASESNILLSFLIMHIQLSKRTIAVAYLTYLCIMIITDGEY